MTEANDLAEFFRAGKSALDIFKGIRDLLPKGGESERAKTEIDRAEKALQASEAQIAKALGYHLCRCTFPPQIMLWQQDKQIHSCAKCGNEHDPKPKVIKTNPNGGWPGSRGRR